MNAKSGWFREIRWRAPELTPKTPGLWPQRISGPKPEVFTTRALKPKPQKQVLNNTQNTNLNRILTLDPRKAEASLMILNPDRQSLKTPTPLS